MLNKILTKKNILIFLLLILIAVNFSKIIDVSETAFGYLISENDKVEIIEKQEQLNIEAEINDNKAKNRENEKSKINSKESINSKKAKEEIIRIAAISEIKDPFFREKTNNKVIKNESEIKLTQNELWQGKYSILEKDLIEDIANISDINFDQINNTTNIDNEQLNIEKVSNIKKESEIKNKEEKNNKELIFQQIKLPFDLLGIIKNNKKASALISYQGNTVIIKENEMLDIFKIKTIKNDKIIISLNEEKKELYLWGVGRNEN